jgi:MFS transporter, PHS family, inorganic phosphate transporter
MVLLMLSIVYWNGTVPPTYEVLINIATLGGSLVGQVIFGVLSDYWGRRRMYGWELVITIAATLGVAISSYGVYGSLSVFGGLFAWKFILGIGVGVDCPLSAVICSESVYAKVLDDPNPC